MEQVYNGSGNANMTGYYYLAPGEEAFVGYLAAWATLPYNRAIYLRNNDVCTEGITLCSGSGICQSNEGAIITIPNFGFEYITYIEGQQITKREVGNKPLAIRCGQPF